MRVEFRSNPPMAGCLMKTPNRTPFSTRIYQLRDAGN